MFVHTLASVLAALATAVHPGVTTAHTQASRPAPILQPAKPVTAPPMRPAAAQTALTMVPGSVVLGGDVGWPNCPRGVGIPGRTGYGLPMPAAYARFVVVGATSGPAFQPNRCFGYLVKNARARHLWTSVYSVASFPTVAELRRYGGSGTLGNRLYRVGQAEARNSLVVMRRAGVRPPVVWVDVETVGGHPWARSTSLNRAVLKGVIAEYRHAGIRVGLYSYRTAWRTIAGGVRWNLPNWVPSGLPQKSTALAKCGRAGFSGGPVVLGQWTDTVRDYNLTCPGRMRDLRAWFVRL